MALIDWWLMAKLALLYIAIVVVVSAAAELLAHHITRSNNR